MSRTRTLVVPGLLMLALISGCDAGTADAGGASTSEAQQLNDAAAMLDADSVSANALDGNRTDGGQR